MSTHLVTGAMGQDGRLLARLLLDLGHRVVGTTLNPVARPGLLPEGTVVEALDITDRAAFARVLDSHRPDVVHNLAGQSSVGLSWQDPEESHRVNHEAVLRMLDVLSNRPEITFVQASSSEIFGAGTGPTASEQTTLDPRSPYAEAKAAAHLAIQVARADGARATNLVLFGHTSELQPVRFAIPGICRAAAEVARGERDAIEVQNPLIRRDWGSARDHVRAFALACVKEPADYVIGTGQLTALSDIIEWSLKAAGVTGAPVIVTGSDRSTDHDGLRADFTVAREHLGWSPQIALRDEVNRMVRTFLAAA